MQVVDRLLNVFAVNSARSIVLIARSLALEARRCGVEGLALFGTERVLNPQLAQNILVLLDQLCDCLRRNPAIGTANWRLRLRVVVAGSGGVAVQKALLQLGLGHLVVAFNLLGVLQSISNHVESILPHARLCPLTLFQARPWVVD